jgi:hypothetical protein
LRVGNSSGIAAEASTWSAVMRSNAVTRRSSRVFSMRTPGAPSVNTVVRPETTCSAATITARTMPASTLRCMRSQSMVRRTSTSTARVSSSDLPSKVDFVQRANASGSGASPSGRTRA